ncbi:hypothetical protein Bache_2493 [Bacteroides helcogenes P 36-108]|uniref:DUF5106 domain-containing protein n=2 Tax=Bacteroides helcogenes TaxID=290053 RepID=E6SV92_BACT6|nr:hypothetical protein Bache_2493 [Bacteroides helcogenes P 36-108]
MFMKNNLFPFILPLCLCIACSSNKANNIPKTETPVDTITAFILPSIPPMLNTPELRANYLVGHYWENTNFADTNYIHHPEITEQAWVDYIDILKLVPAPKADAALKRMFLQAEKAKASYLYLAELADKYLYDPNSPMRNEELYISVLDALISTPILDSVEKIRPQARRELAQKNRIGTKAIDFTYTLASGKKGTLYALNSHYTLLFINNPGCHACTETIEALKHAPAINHSASRKQLQILSLYPDEELDEWKRHLSDFPLEWINGHDANQVIKENNLYDLKAIPTLYLLDKDKKVLLKDATVTEINQYLSK